MPMNTIISYNKNSLIFVDHMIQQQTYFNGYAHWYTKHAPTQAQQCAERNDV